MDRLVDLDDDPPREIGGPIYPWKKLGNGPKRLELIEE